MLARRANHSIEMMSWIRHRLERLLLSGSFVSGWSDGSEKSKLYRICHRRICHRNGKIEEDIECARCMPGAFFVGTIGAVPSDSGRKSGGIPLSDRARKLIKYVVPTMLGSISFFLFTIVDGIFVGQAWARMHWARSTWSCPSSWWSTRCSS